MAFPPSDEAIRRMLDGQAHRGPDGRRWRSGSLGDRHYFLAHTRLSINDLSAAGLQPFTGCTDDLEVTYNGEIYNYPELRAWCEIRGHVFVSTMDGEVIAHLWEELGERCLRKLNGIFAVAVVSKSSGSLVIARDPLGVKPLFYSVTADGGIRFASEPRSVLGTAVAQDMDPVAIAQFLSFLWIPAPRTPYKHVRSLRPGELGRWGRGEFSLHNWAWPPIDYAEWGTGTGSLNQQAATLSTLLHSSVQRQLLSDVPVGIMLSGGFDSSMLLHFGRESLSRGYTIEWPRSTEGLADDAARVRNLQNTYGLETVFLEGSAVDWSIPPRSGDMFADPAYGLTKAISDAARVRGDKVLFSGQGGDELFGGYRRHVAARWALGRRLGRWAPVLGRAVASGGSVKAEYIERLSRAAGKRSPFAGYMTLCTYSTATDRARALDSDTASVSDDVVWEEHADLWETLPPSLSTLRKCMALDLRLYLPGLGLSYIDRASMQHSVEVRVPWLDLDLVRWSLRLPDRALIRGLTEKALVRRLGGHLFGREWRRLPKRGFGIPTTSLERSERLTGERGHRQAHYLAHAESILKSGGGVLPSRPAPGTKRSE